LPPNPINVQKSGVGSKQEGKTTQQEMQQTGIICRAGILRGVTDRLPKQPGQPVSAAGKFSG